MEAREPSLAELRAVAEHAALRVHDALDAAGDDWHEHLEVNPRPG